MLPQGYAGGIPYGVTTEEFQRLLQIRLETLERATMEATGGQPLPIQWRGGWEARLVILERDRDHSLRARVLVRGPGPTLRWTRNVRLVSKRRLNL